MDFFDNEAKVENFEDEFVTQPTTNSGGEIVSIMDFSDLYLISVENLNKWLDNRFYVQIPNGLETIDDMKTAGKLLGQLTNDYAYLVQLLSRAKAYVRAEKRKGKDAKISYEDMIDKRDAIDEMTSVVKMQYQAVSRMITVKQDIQNELNMNRYSE